MQNKDSDSPVLKLDGSPKSATRCQAASVAAEADACRDARLRQLLAQVDELLATRGAARDQIAALARLLRCLSRATYTDSLTGLRNRSGFMRDGERLLSLAARRHQHVAVFFFDVDRLKAVNDAEGHAAGDEVLRAAAGALGATFRRGDVVGRLSGDEFAAVALVRRDRDGSAILRRLDRNLIHSGPTRGERSVQLSAGLTVCPPDAPASLDELLSEADAMMYRNKRLRSERGGCIVGAAPLAQPAVACKSAD